MQQVAYPVYRVRKVIHPEATSKLSIISRSDENDSDEYVMLFLASCS